MVELSPYELEILKKLSEKDHDYTHEELICIFGDDIEDILTELRNEYDFVTKLGHYENSRSYEGNEWVLTPKGRAHLIRAKSIQKDMSSQKINDRIVGFIIGVITTLIGVFVTKLLY